MFEMITRAVGAVYDATCEAGNLAWSFTKTAVSTTYWVAKVIVSPSIVAIGKLATAGLNIFTLKKFIKLVTSSEKHWSVFPSSVVSILLNALCSGFTSIPAIYRQFNPASRLATESAQSQNNEESFEPPTSCGGVAASRTLKVSASFSLVFAGLSTYFGMLNLIDFIGWAASKENLKEEEWVPYVALAIAGLSSVSYLSFKLRKAYRNADRIGRKLEDACSGRHVGVDAGTLVTGAISFFGAAAAPFLAIYSTDSALDSLTWVPDPIIVPTSYFSGGSSFVTYSTTNIPAFYDIFYKKRSTILDADRRWWETPLDIMVGLIIIGDSATIVISNYAAFVLTCQKAFGWNPYGIPLAIGASACAFSTGLVSAAFSWDGYRDTMLGWHRRDGAVYDALDIETGSSRGDTSLFDRDEVPLSLAVQSRSQRGRSSPLFFRDGSSSRNDGSFDFDRTSFAEDDEGMEMSVMSLGRNTPGTSGGW